MAHVKTPTLEEKVEMYEELLHKIQLNHDVTMNYDKLGQLIRNICSWSYGHRQGNGELPEDEQQALIDKHFWKLTKTK